MMRQKEKRIVIQERDTEILRFVSEMRFSGIRELIRRFNRENVGEKAFRSRVKKLEDAGVLKSEWEFGGRAKLYMVSNLGIKLLHSKGVSRVKTGLNKIDIRNFEHDLDVMKIRVDLELKRGAEHWISDRLIRESGYSVGSLPDALFKIDGKQYALEYERSRKTKKRVKAILFGYHQTINGTDSSEIKLDGVYFVFRDPAIKKLYTDCYNELIELTRIPVEMKFLLWSPENDLNRNQKTINQASSVGGNDSGRSAQ